MDSLNTLIRIQNISDFQPLCRHCNLQKRQVCKKEKETNKIYSAKNITQFKSFDFEFPWEKKTFDIKDIKCKEDTYWYDPIRFTELIYLYQQYKLPIIKELKKIKEK